MQNKFILEVDFHKQQNWSWDGIWLTEIEIRVCNSQTGQNQSWKNQNVTISFDSVYNSFAHYPEKASLL